LINSKGDKMADDAFRPQRKSISQNEIENTENAENQQGEFSESAADQLAEMQKMRNKIASDVGRDMENPQGEVGMNISGKVPEAFKQAVASKKMNTNKNTSNSNRNSQESKSEMRVTGSGRLEELIAGIGSKGNMIYEPVELPSKGKFYDGENGPVDGVIHLRPMTGEEEEILATPRFVKKGQAINMIFNRCMKENFDSSNFLTQDRTYMLIYLRGISYTPEYDVEVRDPESDQTFATTINLNDLYVDYCSADFGPENLEDILPTTEYKFRYRLAVGKDEQLIQEYRDRRAKNFDLSGQADDTLLYRTAHLIEEVEGLTDKLEIQTLLKKLPIQDVAYLRTVVNEPPFGVDTKVNITNPYSLRDFEIELPLESNFFFPRAKRKKNTISKTQA
jgi:hypothetical protein